MGKFSFLNEFKISLKRTIDEKTFLLIIYFLSFALGIVLGMLAKPTDFILDYYSLSVENYYCVTLNPEASVWDIFFKRITTNLGYFIVFFPLGLSIFAMSFSIALIVFRGYVLSLSFIVFHSVCGFHGILISIFLILPQHVVTTFTLIFSVTMPLCNGKKKDKNTLKKHLLNVLLLFVLSIFGDLIELVLLAFLFRPISFYF